MKNEQIVRDVYLYGALAEKYGSNPVRVAVDNVRQLMSALYSLKPGFKQFVMQNPAFYIIVSDRGKADAQSLDEISTLSLGKFKEVHLVPEQAGAGIEIAVTFGLAAKGSLAAFVINTAASIALSMALGAIASALAPSPKPAQKADEVPSFLFNGTENVVEQGYPVPLVYGKFTTGSVVISTGINVEEIPVTPSQQTPPPNGVGGQPSSPSTEVWQWSGGL